LKTGLWRGPLPTLRNKPIDFDMEKFQMFMYRMQKCLALALALFALARCSEDGGEAGLWNFRDSSVFDTRFRTARYVELDHPDWSRSAVFYQVNIRHFTPEGTFKAFETHLPRLKQMGVDVIGLMPVHPLGEQNRKGTLGNLYAVKDYYGINPEFGTLEDFKSLVDKIHDLGMYMVIDWVAGSTAWDNSLRGEHPDWYLKSPEGTFQSASWTEDSDIVALDFNKPGLRKYMLEALKFWVAETEIDGYRCTRAEWVPLDFWEMARSELDKIKPVFMVADGESRDLHRRAFDATCASSFQNALRQIVQDNPDTTALKRYLATEANAFPTDAYRLLPAGLSGEATANASMAALVLAGTLPGMLEVYGGQEAGLNRPLRETEKDTIAWNPDPLLAPGLKTLIQLKKRSKALWNGASGGVLQPVRNDGGATLLSFSREKSGNKVLCAVNLSSSPVKTVLYPGNRQRGNYTDAFTGKKRTVKELYPLELPPWGYLLLEAGNAR
jgi:glycosidase